ncbi:hypothetical protein, partial [Escherichia coli]|uniref:hypothetical protein n=1 Tax=Escherichia coli TaxID=562 RepID=UPI001BFD867F
VNAVTTRDQAKRQSYHNSGQGHRPSNPKHNYKQGKEGTPDNPYNYQIQDGDSEGEFAYTINGKTHKISGPTTFRPHWT